VEGEGIQIMSIDNLPTEMPAEASQHFSDSLYPYIVELVKGNFDHPVLKRATITNPDGTLAERHQGLQAHIEKHAGGSPVVNGRRVLLLGAGYVALPLVDYLIRDGKTHVTIANRTVEKAEKLANGKANTSVTSLDLADAKAVGDLISQNDVIVR
jgi:alpha-aminoadipic semialdehyde synthase